MSTNITEIELKIRIKNDWGNVSEDMIVLAKHETDEQFMKRALVLLEALRKEILK